MKKPVGALWDEEGIAIFNRHAVESILKAVGMPDYKAEALVVKKEGAKYVEVWVPHTEYAYRIYPREG